MQPAGDIEVKCSHDFEESASATSKSGARDGGAAGPAAAREGGKESRGGDGARDKGVPAGSVAAASAAAAPLAWGDVVSVVFDGTLFYGRVSGPVTHKPRWFAVDFAVGDAAEAADLYNYLRRELELVPPEKAKTLADVPPVRVPPAYVTAIASRDGKMPAVSQLDVNVEPMPAPMAQEAAAVLAADSGRGSEKTQEELLADRRLNFQRRMKEMRARREEAAKLQQLFALKAPSKHYQW